VEGIALGTFLTSDGRTFVPLPPDIDNDAGSGRSAVLSYGTEPAPSGSGAIATVTFSPVQPGDSKLEWQAVQLTDEDGDVTPADVQGEYVSLGDLLPARRQVVSCLCGCRERKALEVVKVLRRGSRFSRAAGP